jgi:UDP-N-acetylmuramyl pentapeptide synthase
MSTVYLLKKFDPRQLFRFFVDGRFHRKYRGWVGYEAGEYGSVQGILNGFAFMLDNFDLSGGLRSTYLLDLHRICMFNVQTANPKSTPGDLRYLNSGMPFLAKTTTLNNLKEILAMRKGDGTAIFNAKKYAKTADEFDAVSLYQDLLKEKNINYRNWYPNLDQATKNYLDKNGNLQDYYQAKHYVQMMFAKKTDNIVESFNLSIKKSSGSEDRIYIIATLVRDLELLHPFPDGNCRVFACILLNHLLMYFDFYPAILDNPNLDGECSYDEFVEEIRKGMDNTRALLDDPSLRLFDFSITDLSPEENNSFLRMADGFIRRINEFREIYLTPSRLSLMTGGEWMNCDPFLRFEGTGSHSSYRYGYLYFALALEEWKNSNKNVKEEISDLFRKGIRAIVLDDESLARTLPYPVLLVNNCLQAYKDAATETRKNVGCTTVLITGTEGKTGAKVQLYHLLKQQTRVHAVLNSANTETPVLRSLLNLSAADTVEINEVSVGNDEEMRVERARLVNPDICFFTNIGPNHMDMHKTIENLIQAKSSVVEGLREDGCCIVNREIQYYDQLVDNIKKRKSALPIYLYGTRAGVDARLLESAFDTEKFGWYITADIDGEKISYFIPYFQGYAPLASVGILLLVKKLGYDVRKAALDYRVNLPFETMGRLLVIHKKSEDILFYDQSRRGGMHGMTSAFNDLKNFKVKGKIVALVGGISILKDSDWTKEAHCNLAGLINESRIARLYTTGNYMSYVLENLKDKSKHIKHSDNLDELAENLIADCENGDLLFIIGSAYLYLGRVAERILKKYKHELFDADTHAVKLSRLRKAPKLPAYDIISLPDNSTLLVVFEGAGEQYGSSPGLLSKAVAGCNTDKIILRDLDFAWHHRGIRGISNDIFGTIAFLKEKIAERKYEKIVCAGISAGGYAALLVGSIIRADEILAFSPHTFFDQGNRAKFNDKRWADQVEKIQEGASGMHSDLTTVLESSLSGRTVVHIYACENDPLSKLHADHLSSFNAIRFHFLQEKDKSIEKYLNEAGTLTRIINNALSVFPENRIVSVFRDTGKGVSETEACSRYDVPPDLFARCRQTYGDLDSFQGSLLLHFFQGIEKYLAAERQFLPMNEKLQATEAKKFLYTERSCQRWFLNMKKGKGERKVQMFGTFTDFGNPEYLLHLSVGTSNLHVGLVKWSAGDEDVVIEPMTQFDIARITGKLNDKLPEGARLYERKWGPVWCSMDCGCFIDLEQEEIYRMMTDFRTSKWFENQFDPLLQNLSVLKGTVR